MLGLENQDMQQIGLRRVEAVKERGRSGDITGHARKRASALAVASEVTLGVIKRGG